MEEQNDVGTYDMGVAMLLDANCAIVYSKLKACENEYHDRRYWAAGSVREWSERLPELNENQIRLALEKLENAGLVITGNYNKHPFDRSKWYSTNPIPKSMRL